MPGSSGFTRLTFLGRSATGSRPAASVNPGASYWDTTVGAMMVSDGVIWRPESGGSLAYPLGLGVPVGIAPPGTMGNNGAVSGAVALPTQYSGLWFYFQANALYAGSPAGFYWYVPSSTTAGTVYQDTYTPGTDPTIPANPTPWTGKTGPGAYTAPTAEITIYSKPLPGGLLGNNGSLETTWRTIGSSSANGKNAIVRLGGTQINSYFVTTNVFATPRLSFNNFGAQNRNEGALISVGGGSSTYPFTRSNVDTSISQTLAVSVALANAADWLALTYLGFAVTPK